MRLVFVCSRFFFYFLFLVFFFRCYFAFFPLSSTCLSRNLWGLLCLFLPRVSCGCLFLFVCVLLSSCSVSCLSSTSQPALSSLPLHLSPHTMCGSRISSSHRETIRPVGWLRFIRWYILALRAERRGEDAGGKDLGMRIFLGKWFQSAR